MSEAVREVIRFGFETMGLNRIQSAAKPENIGSWRVLEKCGMTFEGLQRECQKAKGIFHDLKFYSILKSEYMQSFEKCN